MLVLAFVGAERITKAATKSAEKREKEIVVVVHAEKDEQLTGV